MRSLMHSDSQCFVYDFFFFNLRKVLGSLSLVWNFRISHLHGNINFTFMCGYYIFFIHYAKRWVHPLKLFQFSEYFLNYRFDNFLLLVLLFTLSRILLDVRFPRLFCNILIFLSYCSSSSIFYFTFSLFLSLCHPDL